MPVETNGRAATARTAAIGAVIGIVGTAILGATGFALRDRDRITGAMAGLDMKVATNSMRIEGVEIAQLGLIETNREMLKELKAIRIALAGSGVKIEVER